MPNVHAAGLTNSQVQAFIDYGYAKLDHAFGCDLARRCRDELWADIGLSPDEPETWTKLVVRVPFKSSASFVEAANTPRLHAAYDQLAGEGRWLAPAGLGTFPIRFPSPDAPGRRWLARGRELRLGKP